MDLSSRFRTNQDTLSANLYNMIICMVIVYGLAINVFMVNTIPYEAIASIPSIIIILTYLACVFTGGVLYITSDNPVISFLGYNLVVVPIGFLLVLFLHNYNLDQISNAMEITAMIVLVMSLLSLMYPKAFLSIGRALFWALLIAVIVQFSTIIFLGETFQFMNFVIILIFCGYVGYDLAVSQKKPKTLDNAIDSAADMYMNIINIFIQVLSASDD